MNKLRAPYKPILWTALVGFLLPIFWGVLGFILFNLKDPFWVRAFWLSVHISCPAWVLLPGGVPWTYVTPFLNAAIYALLALLWQRIALALSAAPAA
jgi:hypothetical protein